LKIFDDEIEARNAVADRYARGLGNESSRPASRAEILDWAQYTIRLPEGVAGMVLPLT